MTEHTTSNVKLLAHIAKIDHKKRVKKYNKWHQMLINKSPIRMGNNLLQTHLKAIRMLLVHHFIATASIE